MRIKSEFSAFNNPYCARHGIGQLHPTGTTHRIEMTESLGGVSYAYLKGTSGEKIVVEERGEIRSTEGDTVGLILDAASARLFDAASETRIR